MNSVLAILHRSSALAPPRPLGIGLEVHQEASAVADGAEEREAAVISLGTSGTRPCERDKVIRTVQSKGKARHCGSAAGPWGYGQYR